MGFYDSAVRCEYFIIFWIIAGQLQAASVTAQHGDVYGSLSACRTLKVTREWWEPQLALPAAIPPAVLDLARMGFWGSDIHKPLGKNTSSSLRDVKAECFKGEI